MLISKQLVTPLGCVLALLAVPATAQSRSWVVSGSATAYHVCDGSTNTTASGRGVYFGEVASNTIPQGRWIETLRPRRIAGRRFFQVWDTGGPGFLIDIYAPSCGWTNWWGRRNVTVKVLGGRDIWRGMPSAGWRWKVPWKRPRWSAS